MFKNRGNIIVVMAAVVALLIMTGLSMQDQEKAKSVPSTHDVGPNGAEGLFEVLKRHGLWVERLDRPWTDLPRGAVLISMGPISRAIKPTEVTGIQKWLDEGGALIAISGSLSETTHVSFVEAECEPEFEEESDIEVTPGHPYLKDVVRLHSLGTSSISIRKSKGVKKIFSHGQVDLAVEWGEKKGHVVLIADSLIPSNRQLGKSDNGLFLLNVIDAMRKNGRSTILFDEYHHGYGSEPTSVTLWSALPVRIRILSYCLGLALLIWIACRNLRFGSILPARNTPELTGADYCSNLGSLIIRSHRSDIGLEFQWDDFRRRLLKRVDLAPDSQWQAVAVEVEKEYGVPAHEMIDLEARCRSLISRSVNGQAPRENEVLAAFLALLQQESKLGMFTRSSL